jgi:hypothetical protein
MAWVFSSFHRFSIVFSSVLSQLASMTSSRKAPSWA